MSMWDDYAPEEKLKFKANRGTGESLNERLAKKFDEAGAALEGRKPTNTKGVTRVFKGYIRVTPRVGGATGSKMFTGKGDGFNFKGETRAADAGAFCHKIADSIRNEDKDTLDMVDAARKENGNKAERYKKPKAKKK